MSFTFPASPTVGQQYTSSGKTWQWSGSAWTGLPTGDYMRSDTGTQNLVSLTAPIYYDYNNTGYYLDPNSTSNLNIVNTVTTSASGSGPSSGFRLYSNSGITASNNYMNFFTGQTSGWSFNTNSTGADANQVLSISSSGVIYSGAYFQAGTAVSAGYYQDASNGAYRAITTTGTGGYYFQSFNGSSTYMYVGLYGTYVGRVGIGTTTPNYNLEVVGSIYASGDVISASDIRFKTGIKDITNSLNTVMQLSGKTYYKDGKLSYGLIAQEVEKIIPEVVYTDNSPEQYKSISYGNIVPILIEAIKELKAEIDQLKGNV